MGAGHHAEAGASQESEEVAMPFKSDAQRRWMYAAEARGEVPEGTASKWAKHTKEKSLPEYASDKDERKLRRLRKAKKAKA